MRASKRRMCLFEGTTDGNVDATQRGNRGEVLCYPAGGKREGGTGGRGAREREGGRAPSEAVILSNLEQL